VPEIRKDPITGRSVIIATGRQQRPDDFRRERVMAVGRDQCPFCPGREALTPPEVLAYRPGGGGANGPGWDVRVVPNKFPALRVEGTLDRRGEGLFDRMSGIGAHEVIIETPDHDRTLAGMPETDIERVLWAYRERILDLRQDRRLRHVLVFKNHGAAAGATLSHSHSQLIAVPMVPDFVREEIDGARRHFDAKERCLFCDVIAQELADGRRVVQDNADAVALAPFAPRFAFETWLLPKRHGARFEEAPRSDIESLARLLKATLQRIDRALEVPPYNMILHTAPFGDGVADLYHWHIEILPKITRVAGFEWGTGFYVNPTPPEEAARVLRAVKL
jgi:UDPglucose--hexose-1-phosphate uridylyltransferase